MTSTSRTPPTDPAVRLTARCPEDLIAVVPVVLGFHPEDSVVMLTGQARRAFHARVDLPPPDDPAAAALIAETLLDPARRNGVRSVAFVFFGEDERAVVRTWRQLRRRCETSGVRVLDALRVDGHRYYPLLGPVRLREIGVSYDVSAHRFAAEAVTRGQVVEPDRAALVATLRPDEAGRDEVAVLVGPPAQGLLVPPTPAEQLRDGEWLRSLVARHLAGGSRPTAAEVARAVRGMHDLRVRDAAWTLMRRESAIGHRRFWLDVLRRTPEPWVPAPAMLFGWAAWLSGHGALAWAAVDRCREVRPDYSLAELLADALTRAIPPEDGEPDGAWDVGLTA